MYNRFQVRECSQLVCLIFILCIDYANGFVRYFCIEGLVSTVVPYIYFRQLIQDIHDIVNDISI